MKTLTFRERVVWTAGLFEGEGSIGLAGPTRKYPKLVVSQKDPRILQQLVDWWGGHIGNARSGFTGQPQFQWQRSGPVGRGLLMMMYPFTVQKKTRIRHALAVWRGVEA